MRSHRSVFLAAVFAFLLLVGAFTLAEKGVRVARASSTDMLYQVSAWPMPEGPLLDEFFGKSVAMGDVNGDGSDDVIVCSDQWVRVYEGSTLAHAESYYEALPMLEIGPNTPYDFTDVAVADVNNDTIMDVIIGENQPYAPSNGWVWAFYGRTEWTTSYPPLQLYWEDANWVAGSPSNAPPGSGGGKFGWSVANAGDAYGDGIDDIIVGAPYDEGGEGIHLLWLISWFASRPRTRRGI